MKRLYLLLFTILPILSLAQFQNNTSFSNSDISFHSKISGFSYLPKNISQQSFSLLSDEDKPTMYLLGELDAGRHYTTYAPFGATFFSSMLFPPAGLVTSIVLTATPPKKESFGLPESKLPLLKDENYYSAYFKTSRKKKILRTWGGFVTGTAFFYAGLRMIGYDYLLK
jgi:hypothetical protein